MHVKTEIKLSFDPNEAEPKIKKIFNDPIAKILWCVIRSHHITDQYFNDMVLEVADLLEKKKPQNYWEFRRLIGCLSAKFGRVIVEEKWLTVDSEIDHEFWSDIYKMIYGKIKLKVEIEPKKEG
jgi:hypothetical protein